jgi:hypothetical protein
MVYGVTGKSVRRTMGKRAPTPSTNVDDDDDNDDDDSESVDERRDDEDYFIEVTSLDAAAVIKES